MTAAAVFAIGCGVAAFVMVARQAYRQHRARVILESLDRLADAAARLTAVTQQLAVPFEEAARNLEAFAAAVGTVIGIAARESVELALGDEWMLGGD